MWRWLGFCWLLVVGVPGFGQGISRLERVQPGATVVVETTDVWGGPAFDRCKLISVEAGALTCVDVEGMQGREVFPVRQMDAVFEIHKSRAGTIWAWIGLAALVALVAATAVTGNLGFLLFAGLVGLFVGVAQTTPSARTGPYMVGPPAPPPPWNKGENGRLVYVRGRP